MNQGDYYQILEVDRNATPQTTKEAYRRLAFQYHPDRNRGNPSAVEKMKEINEAYAVLSDPRKKGIMTHCGSSMDLMATIDLNRVILNRIFLEVRTSIRFLKRWPGPSDSEVLMRSSKSRMAKDIAPSNFEDQESLAEGSFFSALDLEEGISLRSQLLLKFSQGTWVNSPGIF